MTLLQRFSRKTTNLKVFYTVILFSTFSFLLLIAITTRLSFSQESLAATRATTWTEPWDSYNSVLERWDGNGDAGPGFNPRCFTVPSPGTLDMKCQSGALHSKLHIDRNYSFTIQGRVRAEPNSPHNRFWGGIGPLRESPDGNDDSLCQYANLNSSGGMGYDGVVALFNCYAVTWPPAQPGRWFDFKITWTPISATTGRYSFYVDGSLKYTTGTYTLGGNPVIKIYCVSVHPNTPNDGSSAHCQFGPVTVTGVLISNTVPTPIPTLTPSPTPTSSPNPTSTPTPTPSTLTPTPTPWWCTRRPQLCR